MENQKKKTTNNYDKCWNNFRVKSKRRILKSKYNKYSSKEPEWERSTERGDGGLATGRQRETADGQWAMGDRRWEQNHLNRQMAEAKNKRTLLS